MSLACFQNKKLRYTAPWNLQSFFDTTYSKAICIQKVAFQNKTSAYAFLARNQVLLKKRLHVLSFLIALGQWSQYDTSKWNRPSTRSAKILKFWYDVDKGFSSDTCGNEPAKEETSVMLSRAKQHMAKTKHTTMGPQLRLVMTGLRHKKIHRGILHTFEINMYFT